MNITFPSTYAAYYINVADVVWAVMQPFAFVAVFGLIAYYGYRLGKYIADTYK